MSIICLQEEILDDLKALCNLYPDSIATEVSEFIKYCCSTVICYNYHV